MISEKIPWEICLTFLLIGVGMGIVIGNQTAIYGDTECTIITTTPPAQINLVQNASPCKCEAEILKVTDLGGCVDKVKELKAFEKTLQGLK